MTMAQLRLHYLDVRYIFLLSNYCGGYDQYHVYLWDNCNRCTCYINKSLNFNDNALCSDANARLSNVFWTGYTVY